jgi:DUF1365 family protein
MSVAPLRSALFTGYVKHRRLRPRVHAFRYDAYWLLLDLAELTELDRRLWLFSHNRWNVFSFHDRDHMGGGQAVRAEIEGHLRSAGIDYSGGSIRLLCMPRVLGFVFNPLSVHFCYSRDSVLQAIVYEVHNTFRQRHSYLLSVPRQTGSGPVNQHCPKRFYVSPFMAMEMSYRFRVEPPGGSVAVLIDGRDAEGALIVASLHGSRRDLTDGMLLGQFFTIPLVTLKTVAAIHWEALRLWLKGLRLVPRPQPPHVPVTALQPQEGAVAD